MMQKLQKMKKSPSSASSSFPLVLLTSLFLFLFLVGGPHSALASSSGDSDEHNHPAVLQLDETNLDDTLRSSPSGVMLMFHAPWCGHCKRLAPQFGEAAQQLLNQVPFAQVDCTQNPALKSRFAIKGYPTLIFARNGEQRPYKGARSTEALVAFAQKMTQPAVTSLQKDQLPRLMKNQPVVFALLESDAAQSKNFEAVATAFQGDFPFVIPADEQTLQQLRSQHKLPSYATLVRFAEGDDPKLFQGDASDLEATKQWVKDNRFPPLIVLAASMFSDIADAGKLVLFTVYNPSKPDETALVMDAARRVAYEDCKASDYARLHVAIDGLQYHRWLSQFKVDSASLPTSFILDFESDSFYPQAQVSGDRVAALKAYIEQVQSGELQSHSVQAWYSPSRWVKALDKFLSQYDETTIMIAAGVIAVFVFGFTLLFFMSLTPPAPVVTITAKGNDAARPPAKRSQKKRKAD